MKKIFQKYLPVAFILFGLSTFFYMENLFQFIISVALIVSNGFILYDAIKDREEKRA